jgi:hypothetical protein
MMLAQKGPRRDASGRRVPFPPAQREALAAWRRVRALAVPRWMIAEATERRLARDWRGACRAARFDVRFDLGAVFHAHGAAAAAQLEDLLLHFAPDLLRWHLPRALDGDAVEWGVELPLALIGPAGARRPPVCLCVHTPRTLAEAQRLTLEVHQIDVADARFALDLAPHLWDTRAASELAVRTTGERRPLFLTAAGAPAPATTAMEQVTALQDRGEYAEAFRACGIEVVPRTGARAVAFDPRWWPLAVSRLVAEARLLAAARGLPRVRLAGRANSRPGLVLSGFDGDGPARAEEEVPGPNRSADRQAALLPEHLWRRLPDLDLLRFGLLPPEHLHPLVLSALLPDRAPPAEPAGPPDAAPVAALRVWCTGGWHQIAPRDGRMQAIDHPPEQEARERIMLALGGQPPGCFRALGALTAPGAHARLPKELRQRRQELTLRLFHGDGPGVERLLEGFGLQVRVSGGRTLLHHLTSLGVEWLPRLLAAGLDVNAKDSRGWTPIQMAVAGDAPIEVVRALLDAGAVGDAAPGTPTALDLARRKDRRDLEELLLAGTPPP